MLKVIKWVLLVVFWGSVALTLHYNLPKRDIAYVTGVEVKREDLGSNAFFWAAPPTGTAVGTTRDVRFVDTKQAHGDVKVYRNEDTDWSWPPYFKFNSADLHAEFRSVESKTEAPEWVVIRYYGWRVNWMSIYPNAVSVRPIEGPDADIGLPWFNIVFLTLFGLVAAALFVRWQRFKVRRIDPLTQQVEDSLDDAGLALADRRKRLSRWWSGYGR